MIGLDGSFVDPSNPSVDVLDRVGLAGSVRHHPHLSIMRAEGDDLAAYRRLRRDVFVGEQALFRADDSDDIDDRDETIVLVVKDHGGEVVGGVRVAPHDDDPHCGWWSGSRLVVAPAWRGSRDAGAALVRAACTLAEDAGALRFDAAVQPQMERFFRRLGWVPAGDCVVAGHPHRAMRWPIDRVGRLVRSTKAPLAAVLDGMAPGGSGWVGDDAAPVAGSDLLAACDAILPSMVERDPDWAGWCSVLVNINDLAAMGADPVAILDAVSAPTASTLQKIVGGLRRAAAAYGVEVIGGHTQIGVPSSLSVTALGRSASPVPGGGGRPGDDVRLTVDLAGDWRPGYRGGQWDSTTSRSSAELRRLTGTVARLNPAAAKDVSMAGIIGTLGMLAEASGCGAELDVAAVPRPPGATLGDWLTCFPGFAMLTASRPGADPDPSTTAPAISAVCGRLIPGAGVNLVWPDGTRTVVLEGTVTGLGPAEPVLGHSARAAG
jgi:putative N-acetyltransferase (TIGR04045 family)